MLFHHRWLDAPLLLPLVASSFASGSVVYAPVYRSGVRVDLTISHGNQVDARGGVCWC